MTDNTSNRIGLLLMLLVWALMFGLLVYEVVARPIAYYDIRTGECAYVKPPQFRCDALPPLTGRAWANPEGAE